MMSADLSQITFPNYITGIKDGDGGYFKGGYDYQTFVQSFGWSRMHLINDIRSFDIGNYSISPSEGNAYETDWIRVFEFPNGYYIGLKFYERTNLTSAGWQYKLFDNNGVEVSGSVPGCSPSGSSGSNVPYGSIIMGVRAYIFLNTVYYPDTNPPDGTPCKGLAINILCGWPDNGFVVNTGEFHIPNSNSGQGIWWQPETSICGWSDLAAFEQWMKTHGKPFSGDIFTKDPIPDGPAGTDDPSGPGGGGGNYDDTSDPIDFPDPPTGGALECGAVVAHRVSKQTLEAIIYKLWDNSIFDPLNMWQKSISDPMDAIVSLHCLPVSPEVNGPDEIWIGNFDTDLTSPKVTSQYVVVDCGTLNISEYWGSALDYSPYTRAEIYLPFVGVRDVAIEDVMNSTLHIKYNIDVLTGDCIAFIKCGISVLYHFKGNCKMQVPLSSKATDALTNAGLGAAGIVSAAGAVATGGSTLLVAGATISAASSVAGSKVRTGKSGDLSGAASLLDDFVPYIILHRPVQSLARDYNKFKGYPSNITASLGSLIGYTEVEHIHLRDIPNATSAEMEEIKSLLKSGVIL